MMFKNKKNFANLITFSRIIGVGVIFLNIPFQNNISQYLVVLLFTFICLTDLLDGFIARRFKIVSDLGKVLDPLADKILILVFLPLLSMHAITAFPVFIILAREFAVMGLRVFAAKKGNIISANQSGKWKTAFTFPVCGILMGRMPVDQVEVPFYFLPMKVLVDWVHAWPSLIFDVLIWMMVLVTVWSFLVYLYGFLYQQRLQKYKGDSLKAKHALLSFIPNSVSLINFSFGILSMYLFFKGNFELGCAFILIGTILDALDGKLARLLGVKSDLGAKLDSKADVVTFGLAPAVLIYCIIATLNFSYSWFLGLGLALFYYGCLAFRLRRFSQSGGHGDFFQGLPAPAGASLIVFSSCVLFFNPLIFFIPMILFSCFLMISTFPYPHNRIANTKLFFKQFRCMTFVLWLLVIFMFLGISSLRGFYLVEATLLMMIPYLLSPIWPMCRE